MPLPFSSNKARRLGRNLRDSTSISEADGEDLQAFLTAYDEALDTAARRIREATNRRPAPRLKTNRSIIEKLQRERHLALDRIQDIAGLRIVLADDEDRATQDEVRDAILGIFPSSSRFDSLPDVVDRRLNPSHGYRAVHVIVEIDRLPVEIQIRTSLQHGWAEFYEKLGDVCGRGIRYGEPFSDDAVLSRLAMPGLDLSGLRSALTELLPQARVVSEIVDAFEKLTAGERHSEQGRAARQRITGITEAMAEAMAVIAKIKVL